MNIQEHIKNLHENFITIERSYINIQKIKKLIFIMFYLFTFIMFISYSYFFVNKEKFIEYFFHIHISYLVVLILSFLIVFSALKFVKYKEKILINKIRKYTLH